MRPGVDDLRPRLTGVQWGWRTALAVAAIALLTWSWRGSEIDPPLLFEKRDQAYEYLFGKQLDEDRKDLIRERAERTVVARIQEDAAAAVRADMGLGRFEDPPPEFEALVEAREAEIRAAISPEELESDIRRVERDMLRRAKGGYFPVETRPVRIQAFGEALLETLAIAIWGTLVAVILAVLAAFLGAKKSLAVLFPGTSRLNGGLRWLSYFITRRLFDATRGFNEFVLALIFVAIVGLGPFAGVLALAVHTFGVLGKVFADAIETAHDGQIEGVVSTGAGSGAVLSFAVIPQILPFMVSQSLLRFESNVRSASVLGLVGAGGIGYLIDAQLKAYNYQEVATMMILIIIAVTLIDFGCTRIMRRLV